MDPTACLRDMLTLAQSIVDGEGPYSQADAYDLAELVLSLHGWLKGKGFLPMQWQHTPSTTMKPT
jgi:hypothetical protein